MLKEWFSVEDLLELKLPNLSNDGRIYNQAQTELWMFRKVQIAHSDKPIKEYHISNFSKEIREQIVARLLKKQRLEKNQANYSLAKKIEEIAYARFEIVHFAINTDVNKVEFVKDYNNKQAPLATYDVVAEITLRSLYRWIKDYTTLGIDALKPQIYQRKQGKVKNNQIKELVEGLLLQKPHLKISIIYDYLNASAKKEGFELPAYKTVVRYVNNFKTKNKAQFLLASNPDAFKSKYMLAMGSYSDEAKEPNHIWEIDSTPADIMLKEGRCTILGCIDIYTRRVKFLVQKTSNALAVTSLIRSCVLDWGLPRVIKSDNGADYKSKHVEITLKVLKIEQRFVNPYSGWEKPFVERVFRTLQHSHLEAHKDFIGHNVAQRKAIESVKSFAERLLNKEKEFPEYSIEDLQSFLNVWVNQYYINRPHKGLEKIIKQRKLDCLPTPNAMLENKIKQGWIPQEVISTRELDLLLEPLAGRRMIGKKGIYVDNNNYFNPILATYVGNNVVVRVDRFDMGKIYVFDEAHNFICEAVNYDLLGDSKLEFIKKGKAIQNELTKQLKRNTKALINNAKGVEKYKPVQIDLQEAIAEVERLELLKNKPIIEPVTNETEDEGDLRYKKAKELEAKLMAGESVEAREVNWLTSYQHTGEYIGKTERNEADNLEELNVDYK